MSAPGAPPRASRDGDLVVNRRHDPPLIATRHRLVALRRFRGPGRAHQPPVDGL